MLVRQCAHRFPCAAVCAVSALLGSSSGASAQVTQPRYTVDGGGGVSAAPGLVMTGVIGQHDGIAPMSGSGTVLRSGFLVPRGACAADFDQNGTLAVPDIFEFLTAWFAQDPRADFDLTPGLSVTDIFEFLLAWFAGCP